MPAAKVNLIREEGVQRMSSDSMLIYVLIGVAAVGGIVWVAVFLARAYARSMLNSQVRVSPTDVRKGQELTVDIEICPRSPVEIDMIEISITCERSSQERHEGGHSGFGRGGDIHYSKDIVCKETTYIPVQGQVGVGERRSFSAKIVVPSEGLSTDRSKLGWGESQNIRIEWFLTVRFGIVRFPDAIHRQNIFVRSR